MEMEQKRMFISRRKAIAGLLATGAGLSVSFTGTPTSFAATLSAFANDPAPTTLKATVKISQVALKHQKLVNKNGKATLKSYPLKINMQAAPLASADANATFTEYPIKTTSNPRVQDIAKGDTGSDFWFTEFGANRLGRITTQGAITEYLLPLDNYDPYGIANGPGDSMWFSYGPTGINAPLFAPGYLGYITPANGNITLYQLPDTLVTIVNALAVVRGPDDALWFLNGTTTGKLLGRMTPDGNLTMYDLNGVYASYTITVGSDKAFWFDVEARDFSGNGVGRFTTDGDYTLYSMPNAFISDIAAGTENDIWFTIRSSNLIGRITTNGQLTQYTLPKDVTPNQIVHLSNGIMAFSSRVKKGLIGTITAAGDVQLFTMPVDSIVADMVYAGWSGEVWFTIPQSIFKFRSTR
jgi:virginiamycin B lyase